MADEHGRHAGRTDDTTRMPVERERGRSGGLMGKVRGGSSRDRDHDGVDDRLEVHHADGRVEDRRAYDDTHRESRRGDVPPVAATRQPQVEQRVITKRAKTSAAATFALVFGLSALLAVLTVVLGPLGLVLGLIGIVLGVVGLKMTKRAGVTGRALAVAGFVMSVVAVLLAALAAIGITTVLNDEQALQRIETQLQEWRDSLPTDVEVPEVDVDADVNG